MSTICNACKGSGCPFPKDREMCGVHHCPNCEPLATPEQGKWSKELPTEQGWFWYRASNRHHAVATFIENWGCGVFVAVEIYDNISVDLTEVTVEWWSEKIYQPK